MPLASGDNVFFHKITDILAHPDIEAALLEFHDFLATSFPLEGLMLHHFHPGMQSLLNIILVRSGKIEYLDQSLSLSREQAMFLRAFSASGGVNTVPESALSRTATQVQSLLSGCMPDVPRAHLVCCLKTGHGSPGLLRLMGKGPHCFDENHLRRIGMLALPCGFFLQRFLQSGRVREFLSTQESFLDFSSEEVEEQALLIGSKRGLRRIMETVKKLSGTEAAVLIMGETGTGKELIADAIQKGSARHNKVFVKVNCGAIPETLMDSVLFGHEKGAFIGAHSTTIGRFEQAHGGTLFLDELGELSPQAQVRLLRTLQNHVVERVGSTVSIPVDVRIIAATNRNLEHMVQRGQFREDLYHRLNVFPLHIPPLRERLEDLLPLTQHFIQHISRRLNIPPVSNIHPVAAEKLLEYHWPGNVRELENLVERALILDYNKSLRLDLYLPESEGIFSAPRSEDELRRMVRELVQESVGGMHVSGGAAFSSAEVQPSSDALSLEEVTRQHILRALRQCAGKVHGSGGAAEMQGVNADTLRKRMLKLGIVPSKHRRQPSPSQDSS